MFFVAGANLLHLAALGSAGRAGRRSSSACSGYQMERIRTLLDPWSDPLGTGFHTVQGLLALGAGGILGSGLGAEPGRRSPNAFNDFIFAEIGQEFGLHRRRSWSSGCSCSSPTLGSASRWPRPTRSAPCWRPGSPRWLCIQAFINIAVVVTLVPITGITLPFVSAGGSSLIVSFAAVGILLSISRETIEKGTWNDDASADRRRRDGRAHLPGAGRRPVAARSAGRR